MFRNMEEFVRSTDSASTSEEPLSTVHRRHVRRSTDSKSKTTTENFKIPIFQINLQIIFVLILILLISCSIFFASNQTRTKPSKNVLWQPKTIYSGKETKHGSVFHLNVHEIRRNRQKRNIENGIGDENKEHHLKLIGLAKQCGESCTFRLKSEFVNPEAEGLTAEKELKVHFHRWKQIAKPSSKNNHDIENGQIVPLIQYMDSANSTHARFSKVSPNCLYSATVDGNNERGIVNLCEKHGGLFGTLALPDGAYLIEPFKHAEYRRHQEETFNLTNENDINYRRKRSISIDLRPHLIFKAPRQIFEDPSFENDGHHSSDASESYINNTEWIDINRRTQRSRRSADSWDHYVEVLVVADYKMLLYHQSNLESYVLTLFSTVASIYRHPSLRASINIIVVRVIILKHERAGPLISNRAQDTLQQFCAWQQNYNDRNDDSISHHDVAILLTRHDICRATHKCDTLGLAELGTMCDTSRSCAIIEDNGLSAAFTIAHELGHIFNIPHDDERKCGNYMQLTKNNYHIMAPTLEYNTNPWSWSPCSSAMLSKFLDDSRAQTQCILDQPIERKYFDKMFEHPYPGAVYSVNQQCQFVFGANAEICPYMPTCRRLWCSTYIGYQMGCRTQHMPWADGTPCGDNKWCHRGQCVGMAPTQRAKTDGVWGEWRPWGSCSRTCGGGVQKALRDCDNPKPSNGGKYCVGQRERYRPCNIQECPWDTAAFRDVQCSEFDNKNVGIHGVPIHTTWVPKYNGISHNERCKLYCRIKDSQAFYLLREKVLDGTPCDQNGDDICIDGTCHKAGCDHRLGSDMKRDVCGICGGDGSTCQTVEGVYNERGSFGYNEVLKIPAGSANIDIKQNAYNRNKDDDNYLALRASNGEFLLNGQYQVSVFRQKIPVQDAVLEYSGSDHSIERINGTGPIRSDIYLHVLSVGNLYPPNIHYKYMVPRDTQSNVIHYRSLYYWRYGDQFTECSLTCQGTQDRLLHCIDATTNRQTDERHCVDRKPPPQKRMCNIDCFIKWKTQDLSGCSARCGHGEKQQQSTCIKILQNGHEEPINERECARNGLEKPSNRIACYSDCTGRKWSYTEWSTCSSTCGDTGVSRRTAYCVDDANRKIDDRHCERIALDVVQQECNRIPCPKWIYGHWSECSRSCDGGVRMRHAQCQSAAGEDLPLHACNGLEKTDRETCNDHVCTTWKFGPWSGCSVSCGSGQETRTAQCIDSKNRILDDSRCDPEERIVQKKCQRTDCPHWETSNFGPCSVTCQDGWATRAVYCVDAKGKKVRDEVCKSTDKPASHQSCNNGPCPFWKTGDWSKCSVTCGKGVKHRIVECISRDQTVDNSLCSENQQPKYHEPCKLLPCTVWEPEPWGACSVPCGKGIQRRKIKCVRDHDNKVQVDDGDCSHLLKPRTEKPCERERCGNEVSVSKLTMANRQYSQIYWATGPWSDCSVSCGKGTQKRVVVCHDHLRQLTDNYCQHIEKEPDTRECNAKPCAQWTAGPWQPCPATCGIQNFQRRTVVCTPIQGSSNASRLILPESDCDVATQPESTRNCGLPACPADPKLEMGKWETGQWHECSVTCGGGWRRREVKCDKSVCDESQRPVFFERCNEHKCTKAAWQLTPWSTCSVSCGNDGFQERQIWCQEDITSRQRLDDLECAKHEPKPSTRRGCASAPCPTVSSKEKDSSKALKSYVIDESPKKYYWQPGNWSPCVSPGGKNCGRGIRQRTVTCIHRLTNNTVADEKCDKKNKPVTEHKCRQTLCPRWHKDKWSSCSVTCGENGVKKRTVYCKKGRRQVVSDSECSAFPKPQETAQCSAVKCPSYTWKVTPWSKCIDPCKKMNQHRRIFCLNENGKRAANRMCHNQTVPTKTRPCNTSECPYEWVPGPWSTCSKTCGTGNHFRRIDCKVKKGMHGQSTTIGSEPTVLARMCMSLTKPEINKECAMNPCDAEYRWTVMPWSRCSKNCGAGHRVRKTPCVDKLGNKVHKVKCNKETRPKHREPCFLRNCLPNDCAEIKAQNTKTNSIDGNYTVLVAGFRITVYCHMMNDTIPKTFINVPAETNFGEFYGKRLNDPHTCPFDGKRNDSCDCSSDGHVNKGLTRFSRVRVDLHNMKIIPHDFTFAQTAYGTPISLGTAGDCYSASDCPQGRFSIDLRGTGLKIVDDLQWMDHGHKSSSKLIRSDNNALIRGQCGGFCGECAPDQYKGLIIEVDQKQRPTIGVG